MQTKNFYVDLDSIFDVRLNLIGRIDAKAPERLIAAGYHNRRADYFEGIDPVEFRKLYDEYSFENLQGCIKTNIFVFLNEMVFEVLKELIPLELPVDDRPKLEINTWPYELTEEENHLLQRLAFVELGGKIEVKIVHLELKDLAPTQCQNRYHLMVMYHYFNWINAQSEALVKGFFPQLIIVGPQLIFENDPDNSHELRELLESGINPLAILEARIAPRITLRLVSPELFSVVYPDRRLEKKTEVKESGMSLETFQKLLEEQRKAEEAAKASYPSDL